MKHLGDITKIHGDSIEPVHCITFGSPCQDLSIAGKRAGLAGERSGLFMDAVRIIKEMREATNGIYPRFAVWENVPGAFSSNKGEDFRAVLEELGRCIEPAFTVPEPPKGKWSKSGCIASDGFSICWRTFDAQYWGVPQRRKRIALVMDFGGECAPEILLERTGLHRNSEPCISPWKAIARDPKAGTAGHDRVVERKPFGISSFHSNAMKSSNPHSGIYEASTARTLDAINCGYPVCNQGGIAIAEPCTVQIRGGCAGGGKGALIQKNKTGAITCMQDKTLFQPVVFENHSQDSRYVELPQVCETVSAKYGTGGNNHPLVASYAIGNGQANQSLTAEQASTLNCMHDQQTVMINQSPAHALRAKSNCSYREDAETFVTEPKGIRWIVRRLTPLECERLQGFPDGWTDIGEWKDTKGNKRKGADSPRYKALGNSIALPQWWWIIRKMAIYLPEDAKLGSLFDGIGGFPLVWEECHGKGTARWASEIEEFPIAVTKARFPEE